MELVRLLYSSGNDTSGDHSVVAFRGDAFHCLSATYYPHAEDRLHISCFKPRQRTPDSDDGLTEDDNRVGCLGNPAANNHHVRVCHHQ